MKKRGWYAGSIGCLLAVLFLIGGLTEARAATIEELRSAIASRNSDILKLEAEIAAYQAELNAVAKEKQSLQNVIRALDIARNKLSADISITANRIAATDLRLKELAIDIDRKAENIGTATEGVGDALKILAELDSQSPIETVLNGEDLGTAWQQVENLTRFQSTLRARLAELVALKNDLELKHAEAEQKRKALVQYRIDLGNQKKALDANRQEKTALLATTKNTEANYQKLLNQKRAEREQFEQELLQYQSQLQQAIDPTLLPRTGSGVLLWPVDQVVITQYFGNTDFASKNPQVYNGGGHNGIDLRAPFGTRIKAAGSGTVLGTGDTDRTCPNASYGRWVLIRHTNGLSTLYAHLSVINVSEGQGISAGQVIGYSGSTGYATGPHLHFAVYATQGVRIAELGSKALACRGRIYTLPIANLQAYLNPLSYL